MQSYSQFFQDLNYKLPPMKKKKRKMRWKSGGFPYYIDSEDGQVYVCLFISNDSNYGGARPQMPKGTRDDNESPLETGSREASEETGIPTRALKKRAHLLVAKKFRGETSTYIQYAFGFPLDKPYSAKRNNEGRGLWFRMEDALRLIRKDQKAFLGLLANNLKNTK